MRRRSWTPFVLALAISGIGVREPGMLAGMPASSGQGERAPGERAAPDPRDLVAMIHVRISATTWEYGAGILISQTPTETVLVSAAHVVAQALGKGNSVTIEVRFHNAPEKVWLAEIAGNTMSTEADLVVLRIRQAVPLILTDTRRAVLAPPDEPGGVGRGARIIGNMSDRPWSQSPQPEPIAQVSQDVLTIDSNAIDRGASGGGVFSEHGSLLGMTYFSEGKIARALPAARILDLLKTWKVEAGWTVNDGALASAALQRLREGGLLRASSIAEALMNSEAAALKDIGLASRRIDVMLVDRAMRAPVSGQRTRTAIEEYFLRAKDDPRSDYRWLTQLGNAGLDLNLRIAHPYYGEESVLVAALRAGNTGAVTALLKGGASPHGYQRLQGTTDDHPAFLYPLIAAGKAQGQSQPLAAAFADAGMVTPSSTPTFDEAPTDRICTAATAHTGVDWCGFTRQLPTGVQFAAGGGPRGFYDPVDGSGVARLGQLIHVSNDTAFFAGAFPPRARREPDDADVVVEIPRNGTAWFVYMYTPSGRPTRSCKADATGRDARQCWERYQAWPYNVLASWRTGEAPAPAPATPAIDALRRFEIDGLSLGMTAEAAHKLLRSRGYRAETTAAGTNEHSVRFKYSLQEQGGLRVIYFHALGPEILLIDGRLLGANAVPAPDAEFTKELALVAPLVRHRDQFVRLDVNDPKKALNGGLSVDAEAQGGGRRIVLRFSTGAGSQRLVAMQRRLQAPGPEQAYFDNLWGFITDVR